MQKESWKCRHKGLIMVDDWWKKMSCSGIAITPATMFQLLQGLQAMWLSQCMAWCQKTFLNRMACIAPLTKHNRISLGIYRALAEWRLQNYFLLNYTGTILTSWSYFLRTLPVLKILNSYFAILLLTNLTQNSTSCFAVLCSGFYRKVDSRKSGTKRGWIPALHVGGGTAHQCFRWRYLVVWGEWQI